MLVLYGSRRESVAKAQAIMSSRAFDMQIFLSSGGVIFPWSCLRAPEAGRQGQVSLHFRPACLTGLLEYDGFCSSPFVPCAVRESGPANQTSIRLAGRCVQKLQCRCIEDLVRVLAFSVPFFVSPLSLSLCLVSTPLSMVHHPLTASERRVRRFDYTR